MIANTVRTSTRNRQYRRDQDLSRMQIPSPLGPNTPSLEPILYNRLEAALERAGMAREDNQSVFSTASKHGWIHNLLS